MNKNFKSFFKKKRNFKKYSLLIIIVAVFLIIPEDQVNAQVLANIWDMATHPADTAMSFIYGPIFVILNIFLLISTLWVMFGAWLVDTAMSPALYVGSSFPGPVLPGVLNSDAVQIGWATVRDMCNMFFMFFMLAVAFGTILRSKSFNVKNILPKIIIAMFLINFSMVITKMVIDVSQFFMYEIASWMTSFAGEAGSLTSIVHMFNDEINFLNLKDLTRTYRFNDVVQVSVALLYSIILGAIYVMLAIFLLIRLVYFAVLIILSPFAFLSMALPSMSKHTAKWWGELSKWAIFGPVFMFFIFLSATMANEFVGQTDVYGPALPPELGFLGAAFYRVIMASIPIIMLLMAPQVAHELGAKGAAQLVGGRAGIGNIIQGTRGAGKKMWGAGKWGGSRVASRSRRVNDFVEKRKDQYSQALGGVGLHKQKTQFDAKREATKATNLKDAQINIIGEIDIKNAPTESLKNAANSKIGDNSTSAVYLKHLAATDQLHTLSSDQKEKHLNRAKPYLDKKEIEDLTHKDLELAEYTDKGKERIDAFTTLDPRDSTITKEARERLTDADPAKRTTPEEELRREVLAEVTEEKSLNKLDMGDDLTAKIVVDVVGTKELDQLVDNLDEKKKGGFQAAMMNNANTAINIDDANKFRAHAFNAGRNLTGTDGAFDGHEGQIEKSFPKFSSKKITKMTDPELADYSHSANSTQARAISREGKHEVLVKINDSKEAKITRFGPRPYANPDDQKKADKLEKEINSNESFIDGSKY